MNRQIKRPTQYTIATLWLFAVLFFFVFAPMDIAVLALVILNVATWSAFVVWVCSSEKDYSKAFNDYLCYPSETSYNVEDGLYCITLMTDLPAKGYGGTIIEAKICAIDALIEHQGYKISKMAEENERLTAKLESMAKESYRLAVESVEREKNLTKLKTDVKHWADSEKDGQLIMSPIPKGGTVYAKIKCGEIVMRYDNDYEHGTGAVECPFENQCNFGDCDDEQSQILETTVSSIMFNEDGFTFWLKDVGFGSPCYSGEDIGKTVFLTLEEAEKAQDGEQQ